MESRRHAWSWPRPPIRAGKAAAKKGGRKCCCESLAAAFLERGGHLGNDAGRPQGTATHPSPAATTNTTAWGGLMRAAGGGGAKGRPHKNTSRRHQPEENERLVRVTVSTDDQGDDVAVPFACPMQGRRPTRRRHSIVDTPRKAVGAAVLTLGARVPTSVARRGMHMGKGEAKNIRERNPPFETMGRSSKKRARVGHTHIPCGYALGPLACAAPPPPPPRQYKCHHSSAA